jgi:hypothetical protein
MTELEVGDTVTIGAGKIHWIVVALFRSYKSVDEGEVTRWYNRQVPVANLKSGMTTRRKQHVNINRLKIHTKGSAS